MELIRTNDELKQACRLFAEAFQDYPLYVYVFPRKKKRMHFLSILFECSAKYIAEYAYHISSNGRMQAVILMDTPHHQYPTLQEIMNVLFRYSFRFPLRRSTKLLSIFKEFIEKHPPKPKYYVQTIAVAPDQQGKGLGKQCIAFARQLAGNDLIHLETTSPANVDYYLDNGFALSHHFNCDHGRGPDTWSFISNG